MWQSPLVGQASRLSKNDGQDARPTEEDCFPRLKRSRNDIIREDGLRL